MQSVVGWPEEVVLSWASPQNVASGDVKAYSIHYASNDGTEELQKVSANTTIALYNLKVHPSVHLIFIHPIYPSIHLSISHRLIPFQSS